MNRPRSAENHALRFPADGRLVRPPFWLPIGSGVLALLSYVWGELNPPVVLVPWFVIPWWATGLNALTIMLAIFCVASFAIVWVALRGGAKPGAAPPS
jgi:hypothetical protein